MSDAKRRLYERLRGLRERAETARRAAKLSSSLVTLEKDVRSSRSPGADTFIGNRASDWAPTKFEKFKLPGPESDDAVLAMIEIWSSWAGEETDGRWWRAQLELAREEPDRQTAQQGGKSGTKSSFPLPYAVADRRYARRAAIHGRFEEHLTAGVKRILLVGQAGMGKTMLATELPKPYAAEGDVLFISAHSRETLSFQLASAMHLHGLEGDFSPARSPFDTLAVLLSAEAGPKYIILDNIKAPSDLTQMVPDAVRATVIATCRNGAHVPRGWETIDVGRMTTIESEDMIRRLLPGMSTADAAALALCFHGHALVTKYACTLLEYMPVPVDAFVANFIDRRARFVSESTSDEGVLLASILSEVLSFAKDRSPDAASLLGSVGVIFLFCGYGSLSHDYFAKFLAALRGRDGRMVNHSDLDYLIAMRTIHEFRFIEREELECFYVHPLVGGVLAELARDELAHYLPAMIEAYRNVLPVGKRSGQGGWAEYQSYSEAATRAMGHTLVRRIADCHVARVVARASSVIPKREARGLSLLVNKLLGNATVDYASKAQITWRLGRAAYNLIEGNGSRIDLDSLFCKAQTVGGPRLPTLDQLRDSFRQDLDARGNPSRRNPLAEGT